MVATSKGTLLVSVIALLIGSSQLVACADGSGPAVGPSPSLDPVPRAEERLSFEWVEAAQIPESVRGAVELAKEWQYSYQLWGTDPQSMPAFLRENSSEELYERIERSGAGAPQLIGAVRTTVVGFMLDDGLVRFDLCVDRRDVKLFYGPTGEPMDRGIVVREMVLVQSSTDWRVERAGVAHGRSQELQPRCDELLADPPPTLAPNGDE